MTSDPSLDQVSQCFRVFTQEKPPTPPHLGPTKEGLTGASKEQSALFNHGRHGGMAAGGGGGDGDAGQASVEAEAPFRSPELEKEEGARVLAGGTGETEIRRRAEEAARLPCPRSTCSPRR